MATTSKTATLDAGKAAEILMLANERHEVGDHDAAGWMLLPLTTVLVGGSAERLASTYDMRAGSPTLCARPGNHAAFTRAAAILRA